MTLKRRKFLKTAGAVIGVGAVATSLPIQLLGRSGKAPTSFGFQTWTVRDALGENMPETLKKMADLGYKETEFCSPLGYKGTPFEKFNELSGKELRQIIEASGLTCKSSHFTMDELRDHLDNRIEWSKQMGITQMIASSFWWGKDATMQDWRNACHELNEIGLKTKTAGIQTGFHNHHMEFEKIDGELIYDVLMEELDPVLVKMQFQVAVANIGYKAADYFREYPGRFISAHLSDWLSQEQEVALGQGMVDWPDFFDAATIGGVKNYFVEMAPSTFSESAAYLKGL